MPLVNCPGCGKTVSDNAIKCPNCGYLIKQEKKKEKREEREKNRKNIQCKDCGEILDAATKTCPYCGNPIRITRQNFGKRLIGFVSDKKNTVIRIGIFVIVIILFLSVLFSLLSRDEFYRYTKYMGKDISKLPEDYNDTAWEDEYDTHFVSYNDTPINIGDLELEGDISYIYFDRNMPDEKIERKEIVGTLFSFDASGEIEISEEMVGKIRESLINEYGDYDDKKIYSYEEFSDLDTGVRITYLNWEKLKDIRIYMVVNKKWDTVQKVSIAWLNADLKEIE